MSSRTNLSFFAAKIVAVMALPVAATAQYMHVSETFSRNYGTSDAGASVVATGALSASFASQNRFISSGAMGYWRRVDTLMGVATGNAHADLRFLGEARRAADLRVTAVASGELTRTLGGTLLSSSCASIANLYLKVGSTVLMNQSVNGSFTLPMDYRIRIATPYLLLPLGPGIVALHGRVYARAHGLVVGTIDACDARARLSGYGAVSGDASASASVFSVFGYASFSGSFRVNEQILALSGLTAQPGLNASTTWGRGGTAWMRSSSMAANLEVDAILPPLIPYSRTLANWSRPYSETRIL